MIGTVDHMKQTDARDEHAHHPDMPGRRSGPGASAPSSYAFTVFFDNGSKGFTTYQAGVERITGYTADDYIKDPALWHRMIHPGDRALVDEHIARIHDGEPIAVLEHRILHKSGGVRHVRNTSVTRRNGKGELLGYEGWISDVTDRRTAEVEREALLTSLQHMADCDEMTGLLNRRGYKAELERLWKQARRNPFPISLLMVDIDHFKSINDTYGHLVGDEVIKELAALFQSVVRDTDKVCRYAGDEMVVILPWADHAEALRIGRRMLEDTHAHVFGRNTHQFRLTVSIGAATKTPAASGSIEPFLSLADRALYCAKQSGRNGLQHDGDQPPVASEADPPIGGECEAGSDGESLVLVVGEDAPGRQSLIEILQRNGCRVITSPDVQDAREIVRSEQGLIDIALVDAIPGTDESITFAAWLNAHDDLLVTLLVIAEGGAATGYARYAGVYDYISKPLCEEELAMAIKRALRQRRLLVQNKRYQLHLEAMVRRNGESLTEALNKEKDSNQFALEIMASMMRLHERHTGDHCQRVSRIAVVLGDEMGIAPDELEDIRKGALLHDIGKVGIPDAILLKPGPLTENEWKQMRAHPQSGHRIVQSSPVLKRASSIVLSHHERYDGSGYPEGLRGEAICMGARIFAVADAYDAMRSERPYATPQSAEQAMAEICQNGGTQFDPRVVAALARCQEKIEAEVRWTRSPAPVRPPTP